MDARQDLADRILTGELDDVPLQVCVGAVREGADATDPVSGREIHRLRTLFPAWTIEKCGQGLGLRAERSTGERVWQAYADQLETAMATVEAVTER